MDLRVARRYAGALYRVASQTNLVAAVESDLDGVQNLLERDENFRSLLLSPVIARETKERVLEKAFGDRVTGVTMQMLRLLLQKRREAEFEAVRQEFVRIRREEGRVLHAVIASAEPLTDDQKSRLVAKLADQTGKSVEPDFEIQPSLLGGVRVTYDNFVLEGSIRGGLTRLRDALRRDLLKQA